MGWAPPTQEAHILLILLTPREVTEPPLQSGIPVLHVLLPASGPPEIPEKAGLWASGCAGGRDRLGELCVPQLCLHVGTSRGGSSLAGPSRQQGEPGSVSKFPLIPLKNIPTCFWEHTQATDCSFLSGEGGGDLPTLSTYVPAANTPGSSCAHKGVTWLPQTTPFSQGHSQRTSYTRAGNCALLSPSPVALFQTLRKGGATVSEPLSQALGM